MSSFSSANGPGTVMIVDDAPGNLALLSDALQEAGYRVLIATDGISALEQLAYATPDIILLDGIMPGMDGFETCRRLKLNPATRRIPILFMTALSDLDNLLRGFNEGAVDYIVKPFRNEEVLARVGAQLTQARAAQRAEQALSQGGFAALAVDANAGITWLTAEAAQYLHDLAGDRDGLAGVLPAPLHDWARREMRCDAAAPEICTLLRDGVRYSAAIAPCQNSGEYLVLLQRRSADWDIDAVRGSLGLTFKETEVLMWISRGKTNRDIGLILGCSPRTVNKHLEHIFEKLGVETRSAAVAVVMERIGG
ncbi:response regulator transcription factor [Methylococcus sp. EFPC2]|uniref:response regulator transcription factor n=1 Tax=Methylococcus sp. EFPC2 TaxID=2812648 RepID=UPI001967AF85|nr:response regulator transcription factor [Methylococcus sp. EFPC2]QSA97414.1 response regulator transcription factor [Methylococcus sp. EFPC2]